MTKDKLLEPDDDPAERKNKVTGEPTESNRQKRLTLRRGIEDYEEQKRWERWERQHKKKYDPDIIAKNIQSLMDSKGLSVRDTIKVISENGQSHPKDHRWLKRVATEGVVQTDGRTVARLQRLADFFGVPLEQLRTYDLTRALTNEVFRRYENSEFREGGARFFRDIRRFLSKLAEVFNKIPSESLTT